MTDARLPLPALMLVTDRETAGGEDALVRRVSEAVEGGANVVQFRDKDLDEPERLALARRVKGAVAGRALLLINGSLAIAREIGADGVHLPGYAPALEERPPGMIVGRSVHSVAGARRALRQGVDYVIAGSVFPAASHTTGVPAGLGLISDIRSVDPVPVIAIGGISAERVPEVIAAGASGVAVISAVLGSSDPRAAARRLREALDRAFAGVGSR